MKYLCLDCLPYVIYGRPNHNFYACSSGIFDVLAEDVAFRYIRSGWNKLFPKEFHVTSNSPSVLNLSSDSKPKTYGEICREHYTLAHPLNNLVGKLHKELVDGKDKAGADGILLLPVSHDSVDVFRVQLKLGKSKMDELSVAKICQGMETRGKLVLDALKNGGYKVRRVINVLMTTRFCDDKVSKTVESILPFSESVSTIADNTEKKAEFFLCHCRHIHVFWPDEVKALGEPYASNKKLKK